MELRQIRHFLAVAETGSFTKAKQRTGVSQPALTASVAKLEAEYQVKLLDRRRSRVVPTEAGQRLIERAHVILRACNSVRAQVKSVDGEVLRIGVLRTFAARPVCRLAKVFSRLRPDVTIELSDGTGADLRAQLADNRLDAFIARIDEPEPALTSKLLLKERFVLAVANDHRFARENAIRLGDLDGESFIARTGCEIYQQTTRLLAELNIHMRYAYKTDQDYRALSLVSAGIGVAIVPALFDAPDVVKLAFCDYDFSRDIGVFWQTQKKNDTLEELLVCASAHDW